MGLDLNKLSKKFEDFISSEEGKKSIEDWFTKEKQHEEVLNRQLEAFHKKYSDPVKFGKFTEMIIAKYDSDKYRNSWYNRGIEPPEELFWFLFHYAQKYGRECTEEEWEKYGNTFTSQLAFVNGYYFNQMDGQGSVVIVEKEKIIDNNL